jgi:hypothetical protein
MLPPCLTISAQRGANVVASCVFIVTDGPFFPVACAGNIGSQLGSQGSRSATVHAWGSLEHVRGSSNHLLCHMPEGVAVSWQQPYLCVEAQEEQQWPVAIHAFYLPFLGI